MFWVGFAFGVVATVVFLITEHLMGQLNRQKCVGVLKAYFIRQEKRPSQKIWATIDRNRKRKGLGQKCVTYLKSLFFSAGEMPKPINLDRSRPPIYPINSGGARPLLAARGDLRAILVDVG